MVKGISWVEVRTPPPVGSAGAALASVIGIGRKSGRVRYAPKKAVSDGD